MSKDVLLETFIHYGGNEGEDSKEIEQARGWEGAESAVPSDLGPAFARGYQQDGLFVLETNFPGLGKEPNIARHIKQARREKSIKLTGNQSRVFRATYPMD